MLTEVLGGIVESGKAAGQFRADADTGAATDLLLGLYFMGILDWHQRGAHQGALQKTLRGGLKLILQGLAA